MLSWLNSFKGLGFFLLISFCFGVAATEDYSAVVSNINIQTQPKSQWFKLNANIDFRLSPTAKEALQKGIDLSWIVLIKVQQEGFFWNTTLEKKELRYKIKNHALLNLYSVDSNGVVNMFSTLRALLNSISKIHNLAIIDKQAIKPNRKYLVAVKVRFDREALPIPLRPISYFDSQWALSSDWTLWQLQK